MSIEVDTKTDTRESKVALFESINDDIYMQKCLCGLSIGEILSLHGESFCHVQVGKEGNKMTATIKCRNCLMLKELK